MSGLTRERGCLYYVPWLAWGGSALLAGGAGVWIHFGLKVHDDTKDGLDALNASANYFNIVYPSIIATACAALATAAVICLLSLLRGFVEAGHDATGYSASGSTMWLVFAGITNPIWWLITLWLVFVLLGSVVVKSLLYVSERSINLLLATHGLQPNASSATRPCPGECLNVAVYLQFITPDDATGNCICDYDMLRSARSFLKPAYNNCVPLLVGIWVMLFGALVVLVDLSCQFAHTRREKELLRRAHTKQFAL